MPTPTSADDAGPDRARTAPHLTASERSFDLARRVAELDWWHRIDLGDGLVTPGRDDSATKLARLGLPDDLSGQRVLDIGAWDGFFSFEAERRGAEVVAIDGPAWERGARSGRACFDLAHWALGSRVEAVPLDVMQLDASTLGRFDLVLCLGVLYHLRDPWGALARIADVAANRLVLETHVDGVSLGRPGMVLYPEAELNGDASNWWGPNEGALHAMLRDVGFSDVRTHARRSRLARWARALDRRRRGDPASLRHLADQDRVVIHAGRG